MSQSTHQQHNTNTDLFARTNTKEGVWVGFFCPPPPRAAAGGLPLFPRGFPARCPPMLFGKSARRTLLLYLQASWDPLWPAVVFASILPRVRASNGARRAPEVESALNPPGLTFRRL